MPDGIHHNNIHKAGWVVIVPLSLVALFIHPSIGSGIAIGYGMGRYINPDSDQPGITTAEGLSIHELPILGYFLVAYMTLYGIVFRKMHRSTITHFPFVSTAIRWVYLLWWLWFIPYVWYDWQLLFLLCTYIGLSVSDLGHYVSDKIFSKHSPSFNHI